MAVEYVYALHDFEPQNDDEISFVAGERIEVLEKDDAYGDGWWTGRNLAGHEGIFPKDYTTPAGPLLPDIRTPTGTSSFNTGVGGAGPNGGIGSGPNGGSQSAFHSGGYGSTLHPLTEENESDSAVGGPNGVGDLPHQTGGGRMMMAATMTEVQQAIDQLGVHRSNSSALTDDGRSMSFVSTRDGDGDRTSIEGEQRSRYGYNNGDGADRQSVRESLYDDGTLGGRERMTMNEDWHRDARRRLFERVDQMDEAARRAAQEEQERDEREFYRPPVDVEFSDESEDEDHHHHHHRQHQQDVPNDLLHRLKPHHDDSIPSTIPSTFQGDHTNGDEDGAEADVSNATAGQTRGVTDSPAKADSPTLAPSRTNTLDTPVPNPSTSYLESEPEARALTPVQEPPAQESDATPERKVVTPSPATNGINESSSNGDIYLPAIAPASPFAPSPFSPSTPGTAGVQPGTATIYPISSSNIYPSQTHQENKSSPQAEATKPSMPASSSSYVSFLPSPTAASFNTAPSGNTLSSQAMSNPPASEPRNIARGVSPSNSPAMTSTVGDTSYTSHGNGNANGAPSIISSITSTSLAPPTIPPSLASPKTSAAGTPKKKTPPSEWTVDQVVDWVRSKGFDEGICGKFAEHEITGDVLLEFDVNMLKEIDIIAFGKRMKIANAINELRRPPSFESSDAASLNPSHFSIPSAVTGGGPPTISSAPHSTVVPSFVPAASASMPHLPGGVAHAHSMSHSTGGYNASISSGGLQSPNIFGMIHQQQQQAAAAQGMNSGGYSPNPYVMISPENSGGYNPALTLAEQQRASTGSHSHMRVDSDPGAAAAADAGRMMMMMNGYPDKAATIGHSAGKGKGRPLSLAFSPSDTSLGGRPIQVVPEEDDDRAVLSESDLKKRKEVLSVDSAVTHDPPDTPGSRSDTASRNSMRPRSSIDKATDRLSFFGRSRKPAPSDVSGSELGSPNVTPAERQKTHSKLYLAGPTRPPRVGKTREEREKEKKEREQREKSKKDAKEKEKKDEKDKEVAAATVLRKRTLSGDNRGPTVPPSPGTPGPTTTGAITLKPGENVLKQLREIVGEPDHSGFMLKKGERYNTWKNRFFFLKGPHIYYLRGKQETRIKGYINIRGYKVIADEGTHPGRYGFRIVHDTQKPHFFSSEDQSTIREWMKAMIKATIDRDFARPVISSCNIPTIPLTVAQAMNPAPRPPSPTALAAAQRASRQDANGLSSRDAKVLMGIADGSAVLGSGPLVPAPQRPSREMRRPSINKHDQAGPKGGSNAALIQWINSQLPDQTPLATDLSTSLSSGLILFRLAESIKYGREAASARIRSPTPSDPVVPDSLFDHSDERIDGLMKLFDFLLDNDVKLSGISMADIREGRTEKIIALLRSMKQWYDRRDAIVKAVGIGGQAGIMTWMQG